MKPNAKTSTACSPDNPGLAFRSATEDAFVLTGFAWYPEEQRYHRLPRRVLPHVNEGVRNLTSHTAGGMLRFQTDSTTIAVDVTLSGEGNHPPGMARCGVSGFDLYRGNGPTREFLANTRPEPGQTEGRVVLCSGRDRETEDWTLYFPLRNGVETLSIGLDRNATLTPPTPLTVEKPLLYYGSSITHGACASRPGLAYPAIVCRRLNANMINLGFAGSARGEPALAEAIASLDLSAFVFDYDHNAPTAEHLQATHEPFFKAVRRKQPHLPCILVSRPGFWGTEDQIKRRDIIRRTCENAVAAGDRNVYFVDGATLFGEDERDACTSMDKVHPNDIGFLRMADAITPVVQRALKHSTRRARP